MPIISWEGIGANEVQEVDVGSPWGGRLGGAGGGDGERRASKTVLSEVECMWRAVERVRG